MGSTGVDGFFSFTCSNAQFEDVSHDYGDARGQAITIPFTLAQSTSAPAGLAVINVADAVDQTW